MTQLFMTTISSPLGDLLAIASAKGLCALTFEEEKSAIKAKVMTYYSEVEFVPSIHPILEETKIWLTHYFSKNFSALKRPAIDLQGSQLAIAAWKKLLSIPIGKTQSYGELAKKMDKPNASRAIGRIMGKNPLVILVPCHRIIGANGTLTGYGGGLERKKWLLQHEGCLIRHL